MADRNYYGTAFDEIEQQELERRRFGLPAMGSMDLPVPPPAPAPSPAPSPAPVRAMPAPMQDTPAAASPAPDYQDFLRRADTLEGGGFGREMIHGIAQLLRAGLAGGRGMDQADAQRERANADRTSRADRYRQLAEQLRARQTEDQRYQAGQQRQQAQDARAEAESQRAGELHGLRMQGARDELAQSEAARQPLRDDQIEMLSRVGLPQEFLAGMTQADLPRMRELGIRQFAGQQRQERQKRAAMPGQRGAAMPSDAEGQVLLGQIGEGASDADRALVAEYQSTSSPKRRNEIRAVLSQRISGVRRDDALDQKQDVRNAVAEQKAAAEVKKANKDYHLKLEQTGIVDGRAALKEVRDQISNLKGKDIPGFGSAAGAMPSVLVSGEGKRLRQAIGKLLDVQLRKATGAAAPPSETATFREMLGVGFGKSDKELLSGLAQYERYLDSLDQNLRAAYGVGSGSEPHADTEGQSAATRHVIKRQVSPSTGKIRIVYSDGSTEIVDG